MMFWKSSTTTTTTTTAASAKTRSINGTSNGTSSTGSAATTTAPAAVPSYTLSEQRRNELLLAARANRVSWIDGVDEASVATSGARLERGRALGRHAGSSIPLQCQQALEAISTDLHALLSSLEQLKSTIIPNSLVADTSPSADADAAPHTALLCSDCVDADGKPVPYRTVFQDLHEHEALLSAWLHTHGPDVLASPTFRKRLSVEDKEVVFLLAFREFVALLKSPRAAELVYQIQSFVKAFETAWDLPRMLQQRATAERPGGQLQAFIDKLVTQLQHNDKLLELLGDASPEQAVNDDDDAGSPTEFLVGGDDWSAELLHEVLEAFVMEKVYVKALTPTRVAEQEDCALHARLASLAFVDFAHLDLPAPRTPEHQHAWRDLIAQLQQLPLFLSPRRKMDCVLRVCQALTALLAHQRADHKFPSADEFLPALIYVLLRANPRALKRNVAYILEYRRASQLVSEPGYFFTHLVSSVAFLEHVDGSLLTISPEEFDAGLRRCKQQVVADTAESTVAASADNEDSPPQQQQVSMATSGSCDDTLPSVLQVRAKRLAMLTSLT